MAWKMARKVRRKIPDVSMGVEKKVGRLITFRLSCNWHVTFCVISGSQKIGRARRVHAQVSHGSVPISGNSGRPDNFRRFNTGASWARHRTDIGQSDMGSMTRRRPPDHRPISRVAPTDNFRPDIPGSRRTPGRVLLETYLRGFPVFRHM